MSSEVYTVELNLEKRVVLYGGGDDKCTAIDLDSGDVVAVVEDFTDSVVFCKFVGNRFVVGCLDGTVSLMTFEDEIHSVDVGEDISKMAVIRDMVVVGTCAGNVHLFSLDLTIQNVCIGQYNEIRDLDYESDRVYTLTETNFVVFSVGNHQKIMDLDVEGGSVFGRIPSSDVFCVGSESNVSIYKNRHLMNKIDVRGTPECILYMNNYFIVGGDFDYILLISMPMNMRTFTIPIGVSGISMVRGNGCNCIAFSTYCGLVGRGDIRDEKSFRLFEAGVGTIFDLCLGENMIYVGGEHGFSAVDSTGISEVVLEGTDENADGLTDCPRVH